MGREPRQDLLDMFNAGLRAVDGYAVVREALLRAPLSDGPVAVFAIGKAAAAMAQGAASVLGSRVVDALVITKSGHCGDGLAWPCLESGHPQPNQRSLDAGAQLCEHLTALPGDVQLLFLISGGASALVEVLAEGVDLAQWVRANEWLLGSGLAIDEVNAVRASLSRIKGGGLLRWVEPHPVTQLLISDVPGDRAEVIGSGLLVPWPARVTLPASLPTWLERLVQLVPARTPGASPQMRTEVVATNGRATAAAAAEAKRLGYCVWRHDPLLQGDAAQCGRELIETLRAGGTGVHVWGGETTVRLPHRPGRGGRNQHLALAAALALAGEDQLWLLACGTDGSDGNSEDAGALVDGHSVERMRDGGCDPAAALTAADAGNALALSGDLIHTGPTGTNVMDLCIGLKRH